MLLRKFSLFADVKPLLTPVSALLVSSIFYPLWGAPFGAVATVNTTNICSHTYGTERLCSRRRKGTALVDHRMGCPHKKCSSLRTTVTLLANDFQTQMSRKFIVLIRGH